MPGYYCDNAAANDSTACPVGTYNSKAGSSSLQACVNCPVGSYNKNTGQSSCTTCARGYYCDAIGATRQKPCPVGTRNPK
ncbi:unnamed protein product, partial [Rotaria sp. Silwood1]